MSFQERQRVLVRWDRSKPGELTEYAGRVIDSIGNFRLGAFVQEKVRILYEHDGSRFWHPPSELSPLDESAVIVPQTMTTRSRNCQPPGTGKSCPCGVATHMTAWPTQRGAVVAHTRRAAITPR